jgi:hypothetical protein
LNLAIPLSPSVATQGAVGPKNVSAVPLAKKVPPFWTFWEK